MLATSVDMSIYLMSSSKLTVLPNTRLLPARPAALSGNPDPYFREFKCSATTLSNNSVSTYLRYMPDIYTVYCITIQDIVVTSFMTAVRHAAAADTFTLSPAHELVTNQS